MKALSVLQPWALLLAAGEKTVENRTWQMRHRGPLLIHAGKSMRYVNDGELMEMLADSLMRCQFRELAYGAVIGRVEVVDCLTPTEIVDRVDRAWAEGPWCIVCRNAKLFEKPITYRGQLGLFDVPDSEIEGASDCEERGDHDGKEGKDGEDPQAAETPNRPRPDGGEARRD